MVSLLPGGLLHGRAQARRAGHAEKETQQAVVYTQNGKSVGFVADKILDIVEESITVERSSNRKGTLGTVVVQNLVTDLLDAEAIVRENDPTFFDNQSLATV